MPFHFLTISQLVSSLDFHFNCYTTLLIFLSVTQIINLLFGR